MRTNHSIPSRSTLFLVASAVAAAFTTAACTAAPEELEPTMDSMVDHVLAPRCTFSACHAAPTKAAQLDLTKDVACKALVNKPSCLFPNKMLVVPGHPEQSFLLNKLSGEGLNEVPTSNCSGETNALMPFGGHLPAAELTLVKEWIAAGAECEGAEGPKDPGPNNSQDVAPIKTFSANKAVPLAGETVRFTVELERAAPEAGQTVDIEFGSMALSVPVQVFVPAGATTARFDGYAGRPAARFPVRVKSKDSVKELIIRIGGLTVADVLADPVGDDDRMQWIKIKNTTTLPIDLSGYRLKSGHGNYDLTTVELVGTLQPGSCAVVGGPTIALANGEPTYFQVANFNPDLPTEGTVARGFAIFDDSSSPIAGVTTPVDTMLVGQTNTSMHDADGTVATPYCQGVPAGKTARRTGVGSCAVSDIRPSQCQ